MKLQFSARDILLTVSIGMILQICGCACSTAVRRDEACQTGSSRGIVAQPPVQQPQQRSVSRRLWSDEDGAVDLYSDGTAAVHLDLKRSRLRFVGSWSKVEAETVIEVRLNAAMDKPPYDWFPAHGTVRRFTLTEADGGLRLTAKDGIQIPRGEQPLWEEIPIVK